MKKMNLRKLASLVLSLMMLLALCAGCGSSGSKDTLKIAIVQQMDHASLDEIREAIQAQLTAGAEKKNLKVSCSVLSGRVIE